MLVFALLFYEARVSVIPYRDIWLLYVMVIITLCASRIFLQEGRPWLWFIVVSVATGVGYYLTPSIILYPLFLTVVLCMMKRIQFGMAAAFLLIAVTIIGLMVWPHQSYVRAHRNDPGISPPLFWYHLWLGTQVRNFYSTEEERFQEYFRDRLQATGKNMEAISKEEFLAYVKAHPLPYAFHTVKKLLYGTFLVYGNAGDATYPRSWSYFKTQHPQGSFSTYVQDLPPAHRRHVPRHPLGVHPLSHCPNRPFPALARAQGRRRPLLLHGSTLFPARSDVLPLRSPLSDGNARRLSAAGWIRPGENPLGTHEHGGSGACTGGMALALTSVCRRG